MRTRDVLPNSVARLQNAPTGHRSLLKPHLPMAATTSPNSLTRPTSNRRARFWSTALAQVHSTTTCPASSAARSRSSRCGTPNRTSPVVTIEYDVRSKSIRQVKGKNNESLTPDSPHIKQTVELLAFLKNHSVHHDKLDPQTGAPLRREVRAIADLEQLVRKNSLLLATGETVEIKNSPVADLKALDVLTGNFSIHHTTPTELIAPVAALPVNVDARNATPEQISLLRTVGGNLDLRGTPIAQLPDNLSVGGDLNLRHTRITTLPENLTVGGSLYLGDTKITALRDNLSVGGSLYLSGTPITSLPDNLSVAGNLDLTGTNITSLPDNLSVGRSLYLYDTKITQLPDNLSVGGDLYLRHTSITDVPPSIRSRIRGRIVGP